ncbi:hypothetical protein, partial [Chromobacterium haemolyticum]|uniref:hypothetical protein n=1 Tax=Chromobacterium haemolyticum TaxID=394935 RepID=UPI001C6312E5
RARTVCARDFEHALRPVCPLRGFYHAAAKLFLAIQHASVLINLNNQGIRQHLISSQRHLNGLFHDPFKP